MLTRRRVLISAGACGLVSACAVPETVRYRLTLTIDTPNGPKTGSGVIEVKAISNDGLFRGLGAGQGSSSACRGEAIAIDVGDRGWLFAMLTPDITRHDDVSRRASMDAESLLLAAFRSQIPSEEWRTDKIYRLLAQQHAQGDVPFLELPLFVRFSDGNNPLSAERVDPANLAEVFGPGYALHAARIEITTDAVTWSLAKRFAWVPSIKGTLGVSRGLDYDSLGYMHIFNQITDASLQQGA